jgi:type IV pilus assembly protein PilA
MPHGNRSDSQDGLICKGSYQMSLQQKRSRKHSYTQIRGFTLIELMIVIAIIAIILTLALPVYTNYSIRAKIGEALSVAAAAKTAVSATCTEDPTLTGLNNPAAGYAFETSSWVDSIDVSEDCSQPLITIVTQNTGAPDPAPIIILTGDPDLAGGKFSWTCASPNAPNYLLPSTCRSSS